MRQNLIFTVLKGNWFNSRDVNGSLGPAFDVRAGTGTFTPPDAGEDWVLWVTDGTDLTSGVTHPCGAKGHQGVTRTISRD